MDGTAVPGRYWYPIPVFPFFTIAKSSNDIPILPIYMGNGDDMSDSQYTYTLGPLRLLLSPGFSLGTVLGMDRIPESVPTSQKLVSQTSASYLDAQSVANATEGAWTHLWQLVQ